MLKHKLLAAVALGALGTWGARSADAEPAWCKGAKFDDDLDLRDLSSPDAEKAMVTFAHAACAPSAEAKARLADIEKTRAAWGKRLGMVEADWADVIAWIATREGRDLKLEYSTKDLTQYTPIDQYKAFADGLPVLEGRRWEFKNAIYIADVFDTNLSEVGRYGYIEECLKASGGVATSAPPAADWAICQYDIDRFDRAKFDAELRADKVHTGDVKMKLRFQAMDLKKRLAAHAENVAKAKKLDPVYPRMFEIAAAGRTEWEAGLGKNTELLALVRKMNAALWSKSRKAIEGCEAPTRAAVQAAIAKLPASTWKGMKDTKQSHVGFASQAAPVLMADPEINLATEAFVMCDQKSSTSHFFAAAVVKAPPFRGPRTMGFARMLSEKLTLDDLEAKIVWPNNERPYHRGMSDIASEGGVIDKVTVDGDTAIVSQEKVYEKVEDCLESHYGKRILRVNPNGTVDYELICDKWGIVQYDETPRDSKLDKAWAPLLEKGMRFSASGRDLIAIWPNKKSDTPTWILGVNVK